ncbi:MAG: hydroxymethylglutaryl-CoA reductase [Patescibacteria group bacterium]
MSQTNFRIKEEISEVEKLEKRQEILGNWIIGKLDQYKDLFKVAFDAEQVGKKNCENLIGSVEIPVGAAGPVNIKFEETHRNMSALIPLATTEGALVASVNRGCKIIDQSGGAKVFVKKIGMTRSPVFRCSDGEAALKFSKWIDSNILEIRALAESTSSHLKYISHKNWVRGNLVFTRFNFDTDEAMGMNMVTIALQTAFSELFSGKKELGNIELISISGNLCTDKKDSNINRILGRGYWVQAEVKISQEILKQGLKINNPEFLYKAHVAKNLVGSNLAGSLSQNMHVANTVAAFYLATGQDPAHVVEGSQASTYLDLIDQELYISVTLPNLNLGTVGGGTYLPSQSQARNLILKDKKINSGQLAAVLGVAALAGEISGLAALANNTLAKAHKTLGRG